MILAIVIFAAIIFAASKPRLDARTQASMAQRQGLAVGPPVGDDRRGGWDTGRREKSTADTGGAVRTPLPRRLDRMFFVVATERARIY
jgi:hypothetical protein